MAAVRQLSHGSAVPAAASRFLRYVDSSPTPFHAAAVSADMLEKAGFVRLQESDSWQGHIKAGGKYFFTRNQSALVAFAVGNQFQPGGGVHVVGAHTDSPNFRIKSVSKRTKEGYMQCGGYMRSGTANPVETYGGGLWSTWFDRDLSIAGRVIVADSHAQTSFTSKLVHIKEPILRIPNVAIHLNRGAGDNFTFNVEDHTVPILGLNAAAELNKDAKHDQAANRGADSPSMASKHHSVLLQILAKELKCDVEQIQDFELSLYDTQPAAVGGVDNEFIFSPRLDNQMSCFCATEALIASLKDESALQNSASIRAIALFDNEEVGSVSTHGAESNMLAGTVRRLASLQVEGGLKHGEHADGAVYERAIAQSFLISSDMAHGYHPNYPKFYEDQHRPKINGGPVVKTNHKQRYASTAATTFLLRRLAKLAGVPLQEYEIRNDMPCGSTIGPLMSKTGIRTVDIGNPQLAMHSIRETCGSADPEYKIRLFQAFFTSFETVDKELKVD